ncbi:hypothetical protein I5907_11965 [Panacibacter sp. DH6]|uniref:Uncharacterized protein n=1 Tax=Panacibacter microcysteis TaxID=2793269 RepID=A0A931E6A1_9BACT|nr:hypothetical protein [Panacibacter microcysteis]MBG9376952.1 hypothetical protein [Panacibacter microcysteis]
MEKAKNVETLFKFFTYLLLSPKTTFRKVEMLEALANLQNPEAGLGESFIENLITIGLLKRIERIDYALSDDGYQLWVEINQDIKTSKEMSAKKSAWIQDVMTIIES